MGRQGIRLERGHGHAHNGAALHCMPEAPLEACDCLLNRGSLPLKPVSRWKMDITTQPERIAEDEAPRPAPPSRGGVASRIHQSISPTSAHWCACGCQCTASIPTRWGALPLRHPAGRSPPSESHHQPPRAPGAFHARVRIDEAHQVYVFPASQRTLNPSAIPSTAVPQSAPAPFASLRLHPPR